MTDDKLRIALEALLELHELNVDDAYNYHWRVQRLTGEALQAIQREHYLGEPSQAVAEVLGASRL